MDSSLDALMHQLQSAAGVTAAAPTAASQAGPAANGDDDDDDDDDVMAELRALRDAPPKPVPPPPQQFAAALTTTAASSGAFRAGGAPSHMSTSAALLYKVTREHDVLAPQSVRTDRANRQRRYDNGEMTADEVDSYELDKQLFAVQEGQVASELQQASLEAAVPLSLRPASPEALRALGVVNARPSAWDAASWKVLLAEIRDLPLTRSRLVWQRSAALFPRHVEILYEYLTREIEFEASAVVDDPIVARLRILGYFSRHLPLCVGSAKLYQLFLEYVQSLSIVDPITVRELVEVGLHRVGRCIDASPVWQFAVNHMTVYLRRHPDFTEYTRKLFHQWLSTPMAGLEEAGFVYGDFEKSNRAQRLRLEASLDERFKRARARYLSKAPLWEAIDPWFLPGSHVGGSDGAGITPEAVAQWRAWCRLLADETEPQNMTAVAHAHRLAFLLRQRLCWFPDVEICWLDLCRHAVQSNLRELAESAFREATTKHFPLSLPLAIKHAEFCSDQLQQPALGNDALAALLRRIVSHINSLLNAARQRGGRPTEADAVELEEAKRLLSLASCAWLRWSSRSLRENGLTHSRSVALHVVRTCGMWRNPTFLKAWLDLELQVMPIINKPPDNADRAFVEKHSGPAYNILQAWIRTMGESLSSVNQALNARLAETQPLLHEEARKLTASLAAQSRRSSDSSSSSGPRMAAARIMRLVLRYALRAVAVTQAAATLLMEAAADDAALTHAFRTLVRETILASSAASNAARASGSSSSASADARAWDETPLYDASAGLSCLAAAGAADELAAALPRFCRRAPQMARPLRESLLDQLPLPSATVVAKWIDAQLDDLLADAELTMSQRNALLRAELCECLRATPQDGAEAVASRLALGGLRTDERLLLRLVKAIDDVTRRFLPTDGPACSMEAGPHPNSSSLVELIAPMLDSATASRLWLLADGLDLVVDGMAALQKPIPSHGTAAGSGQQESMGEAEVSALVPHRSRRPFMSANAAAEAAVVTRVDGSRWAKMPVLPVNTSGAVIMGSSNTGGGNAASLSSRGGGRYGNNAPQQQSSSGGTTSRGTRIESADDVLLRALAAQDLVATATLDDADEVQRRRLEAETGGGRTHTHKIYTRLWISRPGCGGEFHANSKPPQQLQEDMQTAMLAKLLIRLPTPAGLLERVDPFIEANVPALYDAHAAKNNKSGAAAGDHDGAAAVEAAGEEAARPAALVPSTDYIMRELARATTLSLATL